MTNSMKKLLILCGLFLWACQSNPTESEQGTWQMVRESSEDVSYHTIYFSDSQNGWAVGNSGMIINTENGGRTWKQQQSGSSSDLRALHFISNQIGWAAGGDNTILHTVDGGQTWHSRAHIGDSSRIFTALYFANEETGWTVHNHGEILYTQDGGVTWEVQANWENGGTALLSFVNDRIGYARPVVDSLLLKTSDGGQNWVPISSKRFIWAKDMFFVDEQHGWVPTSTVPS